MKKHFYFTIFYFFYSIIFVSSCSSSKKISQCSKDTDCKGSRICEKGKCINPISTKTIKVKSPQVSKQTVSKNLSNTSIKNQNTTNKPNIKLPSFPNFKKNTSFPNLQNIIKPFLNLNMNFKIGKQHYQLKNKVSKNGTPIIELCINKKCEDLDLSNPNSTTKIISLLMKNTGQANKHTQAILKILKNFSQFPNQKHFSLGNYKFNKKSTNQGINIAPPKPSIKKVYRNWENILKDGMKALGNEAILEGIPVQISDQVLTLKTTDGNIIEAKAIGTISRKLPALAKTTGNIVVKIQLMIISTKKIKGRLLEFSIK